MSGLLADNAGRKCVLSQSGVKRDYIGQCQSNDWSNALPLSTRVKQADLVVTQALSVSGLKAAGPGPVSSHTGLIHPHCVCG